MLNMQTNVVLRDVEGGDNCILPPAFHVFQVWDRRMSTLELSSLAFPRATVANYHRELHQRTICLETRRKTLR